jgi:hypothetical protein
MKMACKKCGEPLYDYELHKCKDLEHEALKERIKELEDKKCKHEFYYKSKWDTTFGRYISMCEKCGVLIGREK